MKKPNLVAVVLGLAFSVAVIYGYVWIIGKGWKKSQE